MKLFTEDELDLMMKEARELPLDKLPQVQKILEQIIKEAFWYIDIANKAQQIIKERLAAKTSKPAVNLEDL